MSLLNEMSQKAFDMGIPIRTTDDDLELLRTS